jgi:hypothetical protein
MSTTKAAPSPVMERRKERRRVNFLLEENGWFGGRPGDSQPQDPWSCTRRTGGRAGRWDAFEEWQRQAKQAQAKTVDGVARLPRKLSLKAIFKST